MLDISQMNSEEILLSAIKSLDIKIATETAARTVLQRRLLYVRSLSQHVTAKEYSRMRLLNNYTSDGSTFHLPLRERHQSFHL